MGRGNGEGYFEVEQFLKISSLKDKHIQDPPGCYDVVKQTGSFCRFDRFADLDVGTGVYHNRYCNMHHLYMKETKGNFNSEN